MCFEGQYTSGVNGGQFQSGAPLRNRPYLIDCRKVRPRVSVVTVNLALEADVYIPVRQGARRDRDLPPSR
jgi:hypothetical protein